MRSNYLKTLKTAVLAISVLLLGASVSLRPAAGQSDCGRRPRVTLPDGSSVPMWGYSCGAAVAGSTATCAQVESGGDRLVPVVITVPTGTGPADQPDEQPVVRERQLACPPR